MFLDGEWWRLRVAFPGLARLPWPLAQAGAARLGRWGGAARQDMVAGFRRGVQHVFPALATNPAQLEDWTARHLAMFARETLDVFALPWHIRRGAEPFVAIEGLEGLTQAQREGRGVILVMAHYSRLIMLLAQLGALGHPMGMLTMRIDATNPALSPVQRHFLQRKVAALLSYIGGPWVSLGDSLRPIYEGLRSGGTWIVLMDAYGEEDVAGLPRFDFLDGRLRLPPGIERLARKTGARLVYAGVREEGRAHRLRGRLVPLPDDPAAGFAAAVAELERDVRAAPWAWWPWSLGERIFERGEKRQDVGLKSDLQSDPR